MNQIYISDYNIVNEQIIIKGLLSILGSSNPYVISRVSNKVAHLKISLGNELSFTELLSIKDDAETLLEPFKESERFQFGTIQLIKQHESIKNQLIRECSFNIKCRMQDFLTDTYFYLQLINPKPEEIYPIIIYQMAKVFNQCNLIRKDQFYELLSNAQKDKYSICDQADKQTVAALELEHAALLRLLNRQWYKLCIDINKQAENYMKSFSKSTKNKNRESNVIERQKVVKQLIKSIYTHILTFLNSNQTDNEQYLQCAFCITGQNNLLILNRFAKRRK